MKTSKHKCQTAALATDCVCLAYQQRAESPLWLQSCGGEVSVFIHHHHQVCYLHANFRAGVYMSAAQWGQIREQKACFL